VFTWWSQVVQHFTELGLRINSARISSDGGWFHDRKLSVTETTVGFAWLLITIRTPFYAVFVVSEAQGGKVRNNKKMQSIKQMLNVYMEHEDLVANGDETDDSHLVETTIFELAGLDRPGLLADVMQLLTHNGCDVRSAAVWTYKGRVAFVFSVTEKGKPVADETKLQRLRQMVAEIMEAMGRSATVRTQQVKGEVHHDRRLHQLMLQDELEEWRSTHSSAAASRERRISGQTVANGPSKEKTYDSATSVNGMESAGSLGATSPFRSPKFDRPVIEISYCRQPNYWTINIRCRDRTKLLFDTVCTLADLEYDIYHATVDSFPNGLAQQEYFVRPRSKDGEFSEHDAALLRAMLESSIQRRFPKGIKVHVRSADRFGCLAALARQLQLAGLSVTRAKVRTFAMSNSSGHTLYLMDSADKVPELEKVQRALTQCGGKMVDSGTLVDANLLQNDARFAFTFLERNANVAFGSSPPDSYYGSI
jgi:UTP:GlnB (protein PII) uridylyltransferase